LLGDWQAETGPPLMKARRRLLAWERRQKARKSIVTQIVRSAFPIRKRIV